MGKVRGATLKIFNVKTYWVTSLFTKEEKQKPVVFNPNSVQYGSVSKAFWDVTWMYKS